MKMITAIKKFAAYVAAVMMALVYTGCTNLDENPYTFIDPNMFYKTEADINAALNNAYRTFRNMAASSRNYVAPLEILTDQGEANYRKETQNHYRNTWSDMENINNTFSDLWNKGYATINNANIVLGRVDAIDMDAKKKEYVKGQALFLRAYVYYHLVRIYGGCPMPLTYTNGLEGLKVPREDASVVWAQIFQDLKDAAEMLPVRGSGDYDVWRVSSGACYALLGEAYLYKATISSEDNFGANKEELQLSKDYSEMVIKQGVYSLMPDYNDNWYWFNQNAKNNQESIFELQFFNGDGGNSGMAIDFGPYGGMKKDGNIVAGAYYCRYGVTLDHYNSYDKNDERLKTFLTEFADKKDVVWVFDFDEDGTTGSEYWKRVDNGEPMNIEDRGYACSTLFNLKYFDPWADVALYNSLPAPNYPMLRYSEVLLNYAEAANLLKGGDGLDELNMVHTRAGLTALPAMDQKKMDEAILQERSWEFVGECKAYYDQLRKGVLGDRAEEAAYRSYQIYKKDIQMATAKGNARMKPFHNYPMTHKPTKSWLWKIPSGDMSSNTLLEQNPDNVSAALKYNWN